LNYWCVCVTIDYGEAILVVQCLQHWQCQLAEQLQATSESCNAVVQTPSTQLQLRAVQQDDDWLLLELKTVQQQGRTQLQQKRHVSLNCLDSVDG
jgi:hypothetical protein